MRQMRKMTWSFLFGITLGIAAGMSLLATPPALAQASVSTGSISGTIMDPQGAAVANARVTITNKDTGTSQASTTGDTGLFTSGSLAPGNYTVRVEAPNFKTYQTTVVVQVGQITTANAKLEVGASTTVVEVTASAVQLNSEQATVQDVLTAKDIDQLPVNGRNFLDLATLEPGVQIQDGSTFDPTKNGYSSLSFGGRYGRAARIMVDGVDISDETVGTTTQNIPESAIAEFQVAQSSLDVSTEVTSTGTVNVVTKSGTNQFHGQGFYDGRSNQISARIAPITATQPALPFGRKQFGGNLGGPIWKDKVFFFGDVERTDQSLQSPVALAGDFGSLSGSFNSPFTARNYLGRMDWNLKRSWTLFYRFSYDQNSSVRGFNPGVYQPFQNVDHTPTHVIGTDFSIGRSTNSIRFEYLKFRNAIVDGVALSGAFNPVPGISLNITPSGDDFTCLSGGESFCSGTNILAPQATFQSDKQIKYDGSYAFGRHTIRYGVGFNKILGGGFAKFFGIAPMVRSLDNATNLGIANGGPFPSLDGTPADKFSNPMNWPIDTILMGNGQGFFTEFSGFGLPAGGQSDNRFEWYVGDQWKVKTNLSVSIGVHYGRDTGRTDSDLPSVAALAAFNNQFFKGLEGRVNQPNKNFSPQLGIAWDPWKTGKTVIRVGGGLYYDDAIFNNVLFDRPGRLTTGLFAAQAAPCFGGSATGPVPGVNNGNAVTYCGEAVGTAAAQIVADQKAYQAAIAAGSAGANPNFIGTTNQANNLNGIQMFSPDYRSPRSVQMNVGIQRQFGKGTVLSVDYVRNVNTHSPLGLDTNKVGDARFLNSANAMAAIETTNAQFKDGVGNPCPAGSTGINCAILAGATIADYAGNGLDSGFDAAGGAPCPTCAFPGINSNLGQNEMLFPIGRAMYQGLLTSLKSNLDHPFRGVRHMYLITSYTLSRYKATALDTDFVNNATDFNNPLKFFGPNGLDRTHQFAAGAVLDFPWATRVGLTTHWATAAPVTLTLPQAGAPGEIFRTDVTGDGTIGDVAPGSNVGAFGRSITASNINNYINTYNSKFAGQLTPAGQALVSAGLFTQAQLVELGAVTPALTPAPAGQVGNAPVFIFDAHASWQLRLNKLFHVFPESVVLEPQVALFNVFNVQNWYPSGNQISGVLNGQPNSVNGTTRATRTALVTPGSSSGVNWYAVPRQAEFGVKLTF